VIVLDASKSMNEDAGNGGTRLDAAKKAFGEQFHGCRRRADRPARLRLRGRRGLRAEACRDTELTIPVGPLDKAAYATR
jgi:hypothetical protein